MKRLRSSEDLDSYGEKSSSKDWGRREDDQGLHRSLSHRNFYYKSEGGRKGLAAASSSSSRYDRVEDDRESTRTVRKRSDYDVDSYDRRKTYDRYRDSNDRGILCSSPRGAYGADRIHRSESFSAPRRDFPKGFRSERDRSRREGSVSSWRRFGGVKDGDEGIRSGSDSARVSRMEADDLSKAKSPQGVRDAKSPAWSKDSGSEQSKSVDAKKNDDIHVESGGHTSEMEEGELEPDPHPATATENIAEDEASVGLNLSQKEQDGEHHEQNKLLEDGANSLPPEKVDLSKVPVHGESPKNVLSEHTQDVVKEMSDFPARHQGTSGSEDETRTMSNNGSDEEEEDPKESGNSRDEGEKTFSEKSPSLEEEHKEAKGMDLEAKIHILDLPETNNGFGEETGPCAPESYLFSNNPTQNLKDKGKNVATCSSNGAHLTEDDLKSRNEPDDLMVHKETDMEGPSIRGFELFFRDPIKKPEKADYSNHGKPKGENLDLEPLELSLSLPNVLLPIGSQNAAQAPGSPSHAKSIQSFPSSFRTNSEGFTMSMSFSGSQHFTHNPSCSLTQNSIDNCEQSVKSRPIFQGVDWQALSLSEQKSQEAPVCQSVLANGKGMHLQSQAPKGSSSGQALSRDVKIKDGNSRMPVGLDRQLSLHKQQLSGLQSRHLNGARSPSQSVGSHETGSEYVKEKKQAVKDKDSSLYRISNADGKEQPLAVLGADFAESVITMTVSEHLHRVSRRFNAMTAQQLSFIKESVQDIILNPSKQWQLSALQKALQRRSDITLEMLLKLHQTQLEILVSLRTGLQNFLLRNYEVPSSDLAEIYLNLRCRNLNCRNLLSDDECDCKMCAQKNGFCSSCMCLVCSKFDMASNTCSWVGCDICLHWCHADCALRESYIRNGRNASEAHGTAEMQFHCLACGHPSEMFGFVKEVFQNFVKEWTAETLSKELEYVKKIFCASEDARGSRLHEVAIQMLSKLGNKAELQEVQNHIISFFIEADSLKSGSNPVASKKDKPRKIQEESNGIAGSSQGVMWLKSVYSDKAPQLEKPASLYRSFDSNLNEKHQLNSDLQITAQKEPVFDELESIVKIKQAEAKMFQARADDAKRESEALKRIAVTKHERIEEEYVSRITKLRLAEAEDMRKQKVEELHARERSYQEYFNMKMRMETDIKDLLLKMEATRRNLTM